jgi:flagellar hook-associated protein 1 FlgK
MSNYQIGISGIHAAQKALTIIGNNIANAATEGYHRQDIKLVPAAESYTNGIMVGQGVDYSGVVRKIDAVLESEILRQGSTLSEMEQRLEMLKTIESAFGELTTGGLSTAMDEFFASFGDLSLNTDDVNLQSEVLSKAQTLVTYMNNLSTAVSNMNEMAFSESLSTTDRINLLAKQIAELNQEIYNQKIRGHDSNNTLDQRDALIKELSGLIGVRTYTRDNGMVDIIASDVSLVIGSQYTEVEVGLVNNDGMYELGLRPSGTDTYDTRVSGGTLGGLFELYNSIISDIQDRLDTQAAIIISETNKLHVQGVGQDGSFTNLMGWTMNSSNVSEFEPPVTPGEFYVRVTDTSGRTVSHSITVTQTSTMGEIAAALAAIPGLNDNTGITGGRLQIVANTGYTFDFLPGVRTTPSATVPDPLAGAGVGADQAPPMIRMSGLYTGTVNQTYTCSVSTQPPGQTLAIGNGTMNLIVTDGSGTVVATVNIGQGYTPGESISLGDGIKITLGTNGTSAGYLNDGEEFSIEALANSDATGFLAAVGINTFFSGNDAKSMDLSDYITSSGRNIAVSRSAEQNDNTNAVLISKLGDTSFAALDSRSIKDYYSQTVVNLGNQISITQMQYNNAEGVLNSLTQQRDEISGVDINDQASLMMVYERMFQAMARYMNTVNESFKTILTMLS